MIFDISEGKLAVLPKGFITTKGAKLYMILAPFTFILFDYKRCDS